MSNSSEPGDRPDYDAVIAASLASLAAGTKVEPTQSVAKPVTQPVAPEQPAPSASTPPAMPPTESATEAAATAAGATAQAEARIWAILDSAEARTRSGLARHLASKTKMRAEDAIAVLAAAPAEAKTDDASAALGNALDREMAKPDNAAGVKPEAGKGPEALADRMVAHMDAHYGASQGKN